MIRWPALTIMSIACTCCLTATTADDKDKPAAKVEQAESQALKDAKPASDEKEETGDDEKFTAKCPVSGEAAKKEQFAAYKDKEVYFCCEKCKAAFEAEPTKYEVKANLQLVQTKQFVQKKCPISGGAINKEQSARVSSVKVTFCCEKCKGAVQSAKADEKLEMIFAAKPFKKGFVAVKQETKDGDLEDKPKTGKSKAAKPDKTADENAEKPKENPNAKDEKKSSVK